MNITHGSISTVGQIEGLSYEESSIDLYCSFTFLHYVCSDGYGHSHYRAE